MSELRRTNDSDRPECQMVEMIGHAKYGMTLGDLRKFVAATESWDETIWLDCRVSADREFAALMDILAYGPHPIATK